MCALILGSLIIIIAVYFSVAHIYTKIVQNNVFKQYSKLDKYLAKRYDLIACIINELNQSGATFNFNEILRLRDVALSLRNDFKNIDRRAAFDGELALKTAELISLVEEKKSVPSGSTADDDILRYKDLNHAINKEIGEYNAAAHKLKTVTEVFPFSFAARFNGVKPIDLYKQVE